VIFAGEIIEKRAFADVGGVSNVFHGGVRKTTPSKKIESSAE
jgi:hypothetical protein